MRLFYISRLKFSSAIPQTDRERLASLQSKVEQLSSQIESAKEASNQMGSDSVESLRLATVKAEEELAKLAQDKGEHEQVITETSTSQFQTCSPLFLIFYSLPPCLHPLPFPPLCRESM